MYLRKFGNGAPYCGVVGRRLAIVVGFTPVMLMLFCSSKVAISCEAINTSLELSGLAVSSTPDNHQVDGRVAHLGGLLKARYPIKVGEPKIRFALISVDATTRILTVSYEQENKRQTPTIEYDVACVGDEWGYTVSRQLSTDGTYRNVEQKVFLKALPNGSIEVRNEDTITRGVIFKTKELHMVTARFNKISNKRAPD